MCGMLITIGKHHDTRINALRGMVKMSHRGELDSLCVMPVQNYYQFGHIRLPIRGLEERYNQPFGFKTPHWYDDHGIFVGEVFNVAGFNDAETALKILIEDGPDAATSFDGFFSVAYTRQGLMHVQTDHLGIKPLYYDTVNGVIASELRAIATMYPQRPDPLYFSNVVKWGYDMTGRTPYVGVRRIAPGTVLTFDAGELISERRYWYLQPKFGSLDLALQDAVQNRMLSDIPVASLCSGGLDSTIVTMLANRIQTDLTVFHVENSEEDFFEQVPLDFRARVVHVKLEEVELEDAIRAADTPVDLGSVVPQYALAQAVASHGFNVVLTGDGADELFGGYRRSQVYDSQYSDIFHELPGYHLPRLDAIMMSKTIELRSPFLAPAVVEIALALPYAERTEKQVLKKYFCDLVPAAIRNRKKHPLKTSAVISGGEQYRQRVIDIWRTL